MVIGFHKQFVELILSGSKKHTIREDQTNRWHAGRIMHMATGVRTKSYNCFIEKNCVSTQHIKIYAYAYIVVVDGRTLTQLETAELSKNDGFESLIDFYIWFKGGFEGKIIHWTDLKY